MKKVSKKLITSVLTLVLTVIALGTTTFAWFSLSTISSVGNVSGTVTAGDGLEVRLASLDNSVVTPWKSNLSNDDVLKFITGEQGEEGIFYGQFFDAVTKANWTNNNFTKSGMTDLGNILLGEAAVPNKDYIEYKVQFRSQQAGTVELTGLTIGGTTITFDPEGSPYVQVDTEDPSKLQVAGQAAYAARVSFSDGTNNTVFQHKDDNKTLGATVTGNHFMGATGIDAGQWSYLTDSKGLKFYTVADETSGEITQSNQAILPALGNDNLTDNSVARVSVTLDDNVTEGVFEGSITIRIWIEGWDADAYDAIYNGKLDVSMIFEKK